MNHLNKQEINYRLLKLLTDEPQIGQRTIAERLGVSVGIVNSYIHDLAANGLIKVKRYKDSRNKIPYSYIPTPRGVEEKGKIASKILKQKTREYEEIERQIEALTLELKANGFRAPGDL